MRDETRDIRRDELRKEVQRGGDSVAGGNYTEYDRASVTTLADKVKAEGRRRKASETTKE